ncbi:hypothetical protein ACEWY4_012173 [Coilia grayii]|uniref:Arrestin C-terminal-like domain-containing protein n=1 Tax=Coilia grayii TaxID=363190 RepID=A0ABD1JZS0_9TELE
MSQTIKKISVTYDAINANNTFICGDILHGRVIVEIAKDTKIDSLRIKFKGKARVRWTERHGKTTVTYFDKEKYFESEQFFIREAKGNDNICPLLKNEGGEPYSDVVAPGTHIYPFAFQFPEQNLPPSFQGGVGFIAYTLEAKLSRSMRLSSKAKAEIHYVPKPDLTIPDLMVPQHGSKDKSMKVFTSGNASFSIHTEKMGYYLGEQIKIVAEVQNSSSRDLRLKYSLYEKISFFARQKRKLHIKEILKEEGEPIAQSTRQTITKVITIPPDLTTSILNCRIIKVEYRLKVYLDIPYAIDPEIKFPIVILPLTSASGGEKAAPPAMSSIGFGGGWTPDQPGWTSAPYTTPQPGWTSAPYTTPQPAWNSVPPNTMPQPAWNSVPPNTMPQPAWNSVPPNTPPPPWNSVPPNTPPPPWNSAPSTGPQPAWNSTAPTAPPSAWNSTTPTAPPSAWNSTAPTAPPSAWNSTAPTAPPSAWNSTAPTAPPSAWNSTAPTAPPPAYESYALYPPLPNSSGKS